MEELFGKCDMPQFVGTGVCDSIGLVIPNADEELRSQLNIPYPAVGLIGSRTGAAAQIQAADEAVKSTSARVVSIEIPRDTKGWGGHGNFIILGSDSAADIRRAVETALEYIDINAGEIYISKAGHMEFQYSARAGEALNYAFGIPIGEAFGFVCASPAPIGMVISDIAMKSADIRLVKTMRPSEGTSHSNEIIIIFTGEASAVKTAVLEAREAGMKLLRSLGSEPIPVTTPYIK
ncbi:MAG: propanediol utilization microcompartment protein PduB [Clostridiales bacterium]|nr:propanediol utilization microcompartment protein PduB [Clostridiales bacterium]